MRKSRRLAAALAVSALVAAGGITVGLVANANEAGLLQPTAVADRLPASRSTRTTINTPTAMSITVTLGSTAGGSASPQDITVTWPGDCSQGTNDGHDNDSHH